MRQRCTTFAGACALPSMTRTIERMELLFYLDSLVQI